MVLDLPDNIKWKTAEVLIVSDHPNVSAVAGFTVGCPCIVEATGSCFGDRQTLLETSLVGSEDVVAK